MSALPSSYTFDEIHGLENLFSRICRDGQDEIESVCDLRGIPLLIKMKFVAPHKVIVKAFEQGSKDAEFVMAFEGDQLELYTNGRLGGSNISTNATSKTNLKATTMWKIAAIIAGIVTGLALSLAVLAATGFISFSAATLFTICGLSTTVMGGCISKHLNAIKA